MTHDAFVLSDVGCVREHNEDDALVLRDHDVYVVADGMGGHASGEIASRLSVEAVDIIYNDARRCEQLEQVYRRLKRSKDLEDVSSFQEYRLRRAVEYGNLKIFRHSSTDEALGDMGTTLVAMAFSGSRVYVAFVGDSRAYRCRDGKTEQLTRDHSLANELIDMNALRPEDLPSFQYKNVIVRALGLQEEVQVESFYRSAKEGDRFVLCSDGLSDLITGEEIGSVLSSVEGAEAAAEELVALALAAGGVDNVTVLVVDVHE
ncbi:MAG: protein phosphatase 2C domain-containing protein [Myxococcota bacterium]|nr:protein phosphatase 2C domain-containing protein [Myxococcota bacterium]MEE2779850.1 protein phosphatase 2C domain-containing protein [Myxococcota bacterium]